MPRSHAWRPPSRKPLCWKSICRIGRLKSALDLPRGVLNRALAAYTKRLMYLQAIVVGADRIDLDGNAAGQVDSAEAGHAIAVLVGILAARAAQRKR